MFSFTPFGCGEKFLRHYSARLCICGFGVALLLSAFACGAVPSGPTGVPTSLRPEDVTRAFSGEVVLPPPVLMNLTMAIRGLSTEASIRLPHFVVPLIAQETSTVDGDWELMTNPPRGGRIQGTLTGGRSGFFTGTLTEFLDGCEAKREFSGQVTLAGLNWVAGATLAPCPDGQLDFGELKLASSSVGDRVAGPAFHLLAVNLSGDGSGAVTSTSAGIDCSVGADADCSQRYREGTEVTLTAAPASGSTFAGWSGDDCGGNSQTASVTLAAGRSCTATFDVAQQQTATLNVTVTGAGSGTVTSSPSGISCPSGCNASYDTGTEVTLTAAPASGSTFAGWSGDDCGGNSQTASVTMDAARGCTAKFNLSQATLSLTMTGSGSGAVTLVDENDTESCTTNCSKTYDIGTEVTLVPDPSSDSFFIDWGGDCAAGTGRDLTWEVTMNSNVSCTVVFDLR